MTSNLTEEDARNLRKLLDAIVIRCREGDKRSNWLPVIDGLATEAIGIIDMSTSRHNR